MVWSKRKTIWSSSYSSKPGMSRKALGALPKESTAFLGKKSPYVIRERENEAHGQSMKVLQKQIPRQG